MDDKQKAAEEKFFQTLEANGQLIDVAEDFDPKDVPKGVTHVRYPDGTVKRVRFS